MSSSRSLSGELLCLYSVVLERRFQLVSFWLPILCERPSWPSRLDDTLSSVSSATLPSARSVPGWWKSCRRFSKFSAQGPSFCQFTLWKAMMQCRLPPTCKPGNFLWFTAQIYLHEHRARQEEEPFWFCGVESPSLCGECPGILGSVCWDQSQCPAICREEFLWDGSTTADDKT